jgi:hypothetical protein
MTMPIRGFNGVLLIGAVQIAEVRGWEYRRGGDEEDTSVMGTERISLVKVVVTGTITVYANQFPGTDPAQDPGQALLEVGDEVALILHPNGTGAGKPALNGTAIILEELASADQAGQVEGTYNFRLQGSTDWVRAAQA